MTQNKKITHFIFDWGDTLMVDDPAQAGAMAFWSDVRACNGVADTLPKLSSAYVCAVASNAADSDATLMRQAFERVGMAHFLTHFVTSKELGVKKPDPQFFQNAVHAINRLGAKRAGRRPRYGGVFVGTAGDFHLQTLWRCYQYAL